MASPTLVTPKIDNLQKALASELDIVKKNQRRRLVKEIVNLVELSLRRVEAKRNDEDPTDARAQARTLSKIITRLNRALKAIDDSVAMGSTVLYLSSYERNLLKKARRYINDALEDSRWCRDEQIPFFMPPRFRRGRERKVTFKPFLLLYDRNLTHEFIVDLNETLNQFVTPNGRRIKAGRDRLIQQVLKSALNENLSISAIQKVRSKKTPFRQLNV
jgi:hypothetical protein